MVIELRLGKISCLLVIQVGCLVQSLNPEVNVPHLIMKSDWVKNLDYSCGLCQLPL